METQVLVAIISAASAILISVFSIFSSRRSTKELERLKAALASQNAIRNARLDYEYEARKRLYTECGPLLFQLTEFSERALGRIKGLARTAADGKLNPDTSSWLNRNYYKLSTYYRLLVPLAIHNLLQKQLTYLDLSLDPLIQWQYNLAKGLADSFTDDFDLAEMEGHNLPYQPHHEDAAKLRKKEQEIYWQQGIPRGILEDSVSALIVSDPSPRVISFREFQDTLQKRNSPLYKCFKRIDYIFDNFHPRYRPVLWRVLIAQAYLYQGIIKARKDGSIKSSFWDHIFSQDELDQFDWRQEHEKDQIQDEKLSEVFELVPKFIQDKTKEILSNIVSQEK